MDELILGSSVSFLCDTADVWSTSSSDDEQYSRKEQTNITINPKKIRKRNRIVKRDVYVDVIIPGYTENEFQQYFRMNRRIAYKLIERLERSGRMQTLTTNHRGGKPSTTSEKAVFITLWYLGNTESFRHISSRFKVSDSTIHLTLRRVVKFILTLRSEYIKWPSLDQYKDVAGKFKQRGGFDNVIGAIDSCHLKIDNPLEAKNEYKNRRGFYSILVQGVSTADNIFTDVYCGEPGSLYDTEQLTNSRLYERASNNPDYFREHYLVGDFAYPALSWLIPPIEGSENLMERQRKFNMRHEASRIVVENAFGMLKGRFMKLSSGFRSLDLGLVSECVMAACILHNICILEDDDTNVDVAELGDDLQSEACGDTELLSDMRRRDEVFYNLFI